MPSGMKTIGTILLLSLLPEEVSECESQREKKGSFFFLFFLLFGFFPSFPFLLVRSLRRMYLAGVLFWAALKYARSKKTMYLGTLRNTHAKHAERRKKEEKRKKRNMPGLEANYRFRMQNHRLQAARVQVCSVDVYSWQLSPASETRTGEHVDKALRVTAYRFSCTRSDSTQSCRMHKR